MKLIKNNDDGFKLLAKLELEIRNEFLKFFGEKNDFKKDIE